MYWMSAPNGSEQRSGLKQLFTSVSVKSRPLPAKDQGWTLTLIKVLFKRVQIQSQVGTQQRCTSGSKWITG